MSMLEVDLDLATVMVAVDLGEALNRVWVSNGGGLRRRSGVVAVAQDGIAGLQRLSSEHGVVDPVIAIEATGSGHCSGGPRSWSGRHPGSVRLFAPSETKAV